VEIPWQPGAHGGGDPLIVEQIFSSSPPEEHLGRNAGYEQGAASILVGIAAATAPRNARRCSPLPVTVLPVPAAIISRQPRRYRVRQKAARGA
jgi:hypothetical protein